MANVEITDGSHVSAGVTADKELLVITAPYPPFTEQRVQPFRQYFTDDGTATGTTDIGSTVREYFSNEITWWVIVSQSLSASQLENYRNKHHLCLIMMLAYVPDSAYKVL